MTNFLRVSLVLTLAVPASLAALAACGDDVTETPTTTTTSSGGTGGTGGTGVTGGGGTGGAVITGGGGIGGSGGVGGSGGFITWDTGDDVCPGEKITLTQGNKIWLGGDTSTAAADYSGQFCFGGTADSDGPDRVYEVEIQDTGSFKVILERAPNSTLDPSLLVRDNGQCADPQGSLGCFAFWPEREGFRQEIPSPRTWHFIVDGANATSGEYVLMLDLEAPACGDGVTNTGEECDDGNNIDNDGCDKNCKFQALSVFDDCNPGEPVVVQKNQPTIPDPYSSNTTGYTDDYTAVAGDNCAFAPLAGGKDRVYQVVPAENGVLSATVGYEKDNVTDVCATKTLADPGCWDYVLYARAGDCNPGSQVACSDGIFTPEAISFPVTGGQTYYIIVDGYFSAPGNFGPYNLHLELN